MSYTSINLFRFSFPKTSVLGRKFVLIFNNKPSVLVIYKSIETIFFKKVATDFAFLGILILS